MNPLQRTLHPRRAKTASFALLALAASLPFVFSACTDTKAQTAAAPSAPPVSVAAALERDVVETQEFSGRIEAVDHADIRPRVSGTIDAVRFTPGAEVKKGDVLVVIDPRPYRAEAARAEAASASAIAKIELAKTQLERSKKLLADNAIAQRDYDERLADTKQLDADARAARATADLAQLNVEFTQVRAPISGRVSKAEVTVGNLVDANVILTSVVSSNPIYASFDGDEQTFARLGGPARALQTTVNVGLVGEEGFPHAGKLEFIDNRVDPATGNVRMRALLDNKDGLMAAGRFARVSIGGGEKTAKVVLINDRAIGTDQDRKFVFVATPAGDDGKSFKADYRQVRLGPVIDGLRVVRSGLKPGEQIVVNGLQRVRPGAPIAPTVVKMEASIARSTPTGDPTGDPTVDATARHGGGVSGAGKKDAAPAS
jgi:membrane fusion protein, multidrug efflux system